MLTERERILNVYRNIPNDRSPGMLDLSHWFYSTFHKPWDLSVSYERPETELIDFHRKYGIGFYLPNLGSFYRVGYPGEVISRVEKNAAGDTITWSYTTPSGTISRRRVWEEKNYAWGIPEWGFDTTEPVEILVEALSRRTFEPDFAKYNAWKDYVGDLGIVCITTGYSAVGQLLNYWMGVENTIFAMYDNPGLMHQAVDAINANNLKLIDLLCESPAEVILMGDNFSSDIQPPEFFHEWSRSYYAEAISRIHRAGKFMAVHIDGRLRGALRMFAEIGADCADAVTPTPTGDLCPAECREDAGERLILSGGVAPRLWLPDIADKVFEAAVEEWIECGRTNPRLIINAGDQVPPGTEEKRIARFMDIVRASAR